MREGEYYEGGELKSRLSLGSERVGYEGSEGESKL